VGREWEGISYNLQPSESVIYGYLWKLSDLFLQNRPDVSSQKVAEPPWVVVERNSPLTIPELPICHPSRSCLCWGISGGNGKMLGSQNGKVGYPHEV